MSCNSKTPKLHTKFYTKLYFNHQRLIVVWSTRKKITVYRQYNKKLLSTLERIFEIMKLRRILFHSLVKIYQKTNLTKGDKVLYAIYQVINRLNYL